MENGCGFAGVHGSGGDWSPQFQAAKLKLDDRKNLIVGGLRQEWTMTDEWYSFKTNPRKNGADVLVTPRELH